MTTRRITPHLPFVPVVHAAGAAERDLAAIGAGIPSRALMQRAGAGAAAEIVRRFPERLSLGVLVATGGGNNGGDGWVVAHALHAAGIPVRVVECVAAKAPNARAERDEAIAAGVHVEEGADSLRAGAELIVVDALLGTGLTSDQPLRGEIGSAVALLQARRAHGATIVALDVPTGLDATNGGHVGAPTCALTVTFGTMKRGLLVARAVCGEIVLLDIGLGVHAVTRGMPRLATAAWFRAMLPSIPADAHKGTRRKVAIVGGASGMAGAVILAARAALRSGAGLVKCVVAPESLSAVQEAEPNALAAVWPVDDDAMARTITDWADAVLIGPGFGTQGARTLIERLLSHYRGPIVLDADALNAFAGDAASLHPFMNQRAALLTPHPAEFARLAATEVDSVLEHRFEGPSQLAGATGASVLLKGVPTVVSSPGGNTIVVAEGTPILATGGAGDVLGGIAVTLLAQTGDATLAGALAAFAHGRAAYDVSARSVRGHTLDDVLAALPSVWSLEPPAPRPPVLIELPAVGEETP
jgi:NAD(P)H-hydrate epimerase